ncbi:MAG: S8 family serine peptidase [Anaerolineae bacterium]
MDHVKKTSLSLSVVVFLVLMLLLANVAPALAAPSPAGENRMPVLIGFSRQPGPTEQALVHRLGGSIRYTYHLVPGMAATLPESAIDALRRNPNVTSVDVDGQVWAVDTQTELNSVWGVKRIGAGDVHPYSTGQGIRVAIIDSGIDYSHPDLAANLDMALLGYDLVNDDPDPMDDYGHGTHVAGTVAAVANGSGVVGVAPQATLYAVKVLDGNGYGSWSNIVAGMQWAVDNGMQIANLSLGTDRDPGTLVKQVFDNAESLGMVIVAAAGNNGASPSKRGNVIWPAKYPSVIAVSATDANDVLASFSSRGPEVELAAPGVSVLSTWNDNTSPLDPQPVCDDATACYKYGSGTSMASPHVAGVAALVWAAYPSWTNSEVRARLSSTADDLGVAGRDSQFGYGLVNAARAVPAPVAVHDVAIVAIEAPSSVHVGDTVTVRVNVMNLGTFAENVTVSLIDTTPAATLGNVTLSLLTGVSTTLDFSWDTSAASLGAHVLNASHSLSDDNSGNDSLSTTLYVTQEPQAATTMHVGSMTGERTLTGKSGKWAAFVTVTIVDTNGSPVSNATVIGAWSGATTGTASGITASNGSVTLSTGSMSGGTSVTFAIEGVTHPTLTYDPEANTSTEITLVK